MSSLADLEPSETEKFKLGEFTGKMYYSNYLYNDRFLTFIYDDNTLCILDLFHMKSKKFVVQWNSEPITSRNNRFPNERFLSTCAIFLTDLHTVIVQVLNDSRNRRILIGFIVLHLDYEKSIATFKRSRIQMNRDRLLLHTRFFQPTNNGFEWICTYNGQNWLKNFNYYKMSFLNDYHIEEIATQHIELSKDFYCSGIVDNNVYGFWREDDNKSDFSKLVQVSLETKKETTLKVSGWPTDTRYSIYDSIWIGRTSVTEFGSFDDTQQHLYVLNLNSLHWSKLEVHFAFGISNLISNYNNALIVETKREKRKVKRHYYRFNFNRPDTLVNLSRYAIKQDSQILQDVVKHLPNQFKLPFTE